MKHINIEIAGECGTGKTTIAHTIGNILKANGMKVIVLDDEFNDAAITPENLNRNLKAIGTNGEVTIRCRQVMRKCL
jgi:uridine kinase